MKHLLLLPFCLVCIGPGISPVVAAAPAAAAPAVASAQRYQLSTHILDVGRGRPAAGVPILLYRLSKQEDTWEKVGEGVTDRNGRIGNFLPQSQSNDGIYKLRSRRESTSANRSRSRSIRLSKWSLKSAAPGITISRSPCRRTGTAPTAATEAADFAENSRCAPDWRFVALPVESPGYCVPGEEASRLFAGEFSSCRQFVGRKMNKNSRGNPRKRTKL